jgi:hypothetical protein
MLPVNIDYSINSIAGSLLHDEGISTEATEGNHASDVVSQQKYVNQMV